MMNSRWRRCKTFQKSSGQDSSLGRRPRESTFLPFFEQLADHWKAEFPTGDEAPLCSGLGAVAQFEFLLALRSSRLCSCRSGKLLFPGLQCRLAPGPVPGRGMIRDIDLRHAALLSVEWLPRRARVTASMASS